MSNHPGFLPAILEIPDTPNAIEILHTQFQRDFPPEPPPMHFGKPVRFNDLVRPDGDGKLEHFWHIVSYDQHPDAPRTIDRRRAEKLPWAKPIIESQKRPEILIFEEVCKPFTKRYLWLAEDSYVIIFLCKKVCYHWVTAFAVNDYKKGQFEKGLKNGTYKLVE